MFKRMIVLSGISGIGKSTTISRIKNEFDFVHLQASQMIKEFFQKSNKLNYTSEQLRTRDASENQQALISVLQTLPDDGNYIFDAHSVIDTPNGMHKIPSEVFKAANPNHLIFLFDKPNEILRRRLRDGTRTRPERSADELADHQNLALANMAEIATKLDRSLTVLSTSKIDELKFLIRSSFNLHQEN